MQSPVTPDIPPVRELQSSKERLLKLEHELLQCRQERAEARIAEDQFYTLSKRVQDFAFITFDPQRRIVSWSKGAERIFGYQEQEAVGQPASMIFTPEDRASGEVENELDTASREGCSEDNRWHLRRDGTRFWGSGILTAHHDGQSNLQGYSKVMQDLTSQRLLQEQLQESEERLRLFSENVRDYAFIPVTSSGEVSGWNPGAERAFGYLEADIIGRPANVFFTLEDREGGEPEKDLDRAVAEGRAENSRWMMRRDGTRFWAHWTTTPMYDVAGRLRGFAKVLQDETERKQSDDLNVQTLQEQDLLLREIHHRVKNNLQVITSILSLQAGLVGDAEFRVVLGELQGRVRAIAALHETLYGSRDLANIDFGPYIRQLLHELFGFHGIDSKRIELCMETDDVVLSIEQALPLGLIVNELVSNSLKHAFPDGRCGAIEVQFRYLAGAAQAPGTLEQGWCDLSVRDDGVGIAADTGIWNKESLGLRMVQLFTKQLGGQLTLDTSHSTYFRLRFPLEDFNPEALAVSGSE